MLSATGISRPESRNSQNPAAARTQSMAALDAHLQNQPGHISRMTITLRGDDVLVEQGRTSPELRGGGA